MRKPEDQNTTATNADLFYLGETLKSKKQVQQMHIYFKLCETLKTKKKTATVVDLFLIMRKPEDQKTTGRNADLL